jgi:hypothetical protein
MIWVRDGPGLEPPWRLLWNYLLRLTGYSLSGGLTTRMNEAKRGCLKNRRPLLFCTHYLKTVKGLLNKEEYFNPDYI